MVRNTNPSKMVKKEFSELLFLFCMFLIFDTCSLIKSLSYPPPSQKNQLNGRCKPILINLLYTFNLRRLLAPLEVWKPLKYTSTLKNIFPLHDQLLNVFCQICLYTCTSLCSYVTYKINAKVQWVFCILNWCCLPGRNSPNLL